MDPHCGDPEDGRVKGPDDKKKSDIFAAGFINAKVIEQKNHAQRNPESPIGNKSGVPEIIAAFELLKTGDHLCNTAKYKPQSKDGAHAAPPQVMKLKNQGGESKAGQTDHGGIARSGCVVLLCHEKFLLLVALIAEFGSLFGLQSKIFVFSMFVSSIVLLRAIDMPVSNFNFYINFQSIIV
jgi:hypothetical protein